MEENKENQLGYVQDHDGPKSGNIMGMWLMNFFYPKLMKQKGYLEDILNLPPI